MSAFWMCLSGLPASTMSAVHDVGVMRISSWVVGTLVRRYAFASTRIRDWRGRFGKSKLPFTSVPTTREPCVTEALMIPLSVKSSTTRPCRSIVFTQPPMTVATNRMRMGSTDALRCLRRLRMREKASGLAGGRRDVELCHQPPKGQGEHGNRDPAGDSARHRARRFGDDSVREQLIRPEPDRAHKR